MFTEVMLLSIGALSVIAAGIPLVSRLAEPATWRPRYPIPERQRATARPVETRRSFEPLDLGPDPVRWPSETNRPDAARPLPDWPSARWDDPHFGAAARAARSGASSAQPPPRAQERRARPPKPQDAPAPRPERAREAAPQSPAARGEHAGHDPLVVFADELRGALPGIEEIERLMAQHGLAGTVKTLMDHTGMDFREAAEHLARLRKGRR